VVTRTAGGVVVLERPAELFLHHFQLITNWTPEQMDGPALRAMYREHGTAEGHMGELMAVLDPALSSSPRPKPHYRGEEPVQRSLSGDSFAQNEVLLLRNVLAYDHVHVARVMMEAASDEGWSFADCASAYCASAPGCWSRGGGRR